MRDTLRTLSLFLALCLLPAPAFAWGFVGHRLIMSRAIDLLPPELKPFFVANRAEVVFRVIDPDLWRNVGWPEDPNHFLDFGVPEYGKYPFTELPREYGAALEKFGKATLDRNGVVPWRLAEIFGNLRRGLDGFRRQSPSSVSDAILFSAVMSHYIQDAHQPFHATINYDGVQTGQRGIHSRFERDLIERFQSRLTMTPAAPKPITNPRDAAFEVLLSSYQLVDAVLKADKDASAGKEMYDDEYFEKFFVSVRPILERRLSEAITATAGLIIGAWEQAGRPAVRLQAARPVGKVEKVSR
jgi:hypothetical protein